MVFTIMDQATHVILVLDSENMLYKDMLIFSEGNTDGTTHVPSSTESPVIIGI